MKTWIIEPRDSLIVRDGRPFGVGAGVQATSLDFPFPSTTTGGVRTRAGLNDDGIFDTNAIDAVKRIHVLGPLLVELNPEGEIHDWLMPAPADALLMGNNTDNKTAVVKRLTPLAIDSRLTNLDPGLLPVGAGSLLVGKPLSGPPKFWHWARFEQWLLHPEDFSIGLEDLGNSGPEKDSRIHASLNESLTTGMASENNLFQTRGLEFRTLSKGATLQSAKRLALAVIVHDSTQANRIRPGLAPLAGERRLVAWRHASDQQLLVRHCPEKIKNGIMESRCCRLVLLTPGFFKAGSHPEWILKSRNNVTPSLIAIAHNHYRVVSGWDFAKVRKKNDKQILGEPKPTRRLMPSGSILFLKLEGDERSVSNWIDDVWFSCVSDDDPAGYSHPREDGFGVAILGTWDGIPLEME